MPRRSSRPKPAEDPNIEKRVTRRSLRGPAEPEPEPEAPATVKSPSPSPSRGRGRGRGRGASQRSGRGAAEENVEAAAPEDATEAAPEVEEEEAPAPPQKSPARGRGRGRGRGRAAKARPRPAEAEDEPEEEVKPSPARPRRSRSAQSTPKSTPTPTRRGRRGRSSAAPDDEEEMPALESPQKENTEEEKAKEEQEKESPGASKKRKRESVEAKVEEKSEKKQKVEEEEERTEETEKCEEARDEEEPMEVDESPDVKETKPTEKAEKKEESTEAKAATEEPETQSKVEEPAAKSEDSNDNETEQKTEKLDEPTPQTSQTVDKVEDAKTKVAESKEGKKVEAAEEAKETTTEDVLKGYVVINMEDVPASDSAEVSQSTPAPAQSKEEAAKMPIEDKPDTEPAQSEADKADDEPKQDSSNQDGKMAEQSNSETPEKMAAENGSSHLPNSSPEVNSNISNGTMTNSVDTNTDPLFSRKYMPNPNLAAPIDAKQKFTLVSYNILADCHSLKSPTLYNWITTSDLKMETRHKRFMQELEHLDADVICLQEVGTDYYNNVLKPSLQSSGYNGCFKKRLDCEEGSATFYRTTRFQLCSSRELSLYDLAVKELETCGLDTEKAAAVKASIDRPTVVLITQLKCTQSQKVVTVGNTHVSWDNLKRSDLQCIQAACAVREVVAAADGPDNAHVLCGDFNATSTSPVYQLMKEGYLNDASLTTLQAMTNSPVAGGEPQALVNLWFKGFQHTSPNMRSSYNLVTGGEPETTRYANIAECREADYIWCGGSNLDVAGVLSASPVSLITTGIPNNVFPSDHLSLKAELYFK